MNFYSTKSQKSYVALITVLIVAAIVLMVGIGVSLGSIMEIEINLLKSQSLKAYYLANLCAEESLMKLKEDVSYPGNETLSLENGTCTILPIEEQWEIRVSGNVSNQIKKMKIVISQVNPEIIVASWQEVADF